MKTLKQFFKHPETYIGIVTAFAFLLIFFCVWMTAYNGVTDRVKNLKIGLVNEDKQIGAMIEKELIENLPFKIESYSSNGVAKKEMNHRELNMVIHIPESFSGNLQKKGKTEIQYFINQANASLAKQMMDGAAKNITQTVNENVYAYQQQLLLSQLPNQLKTAVQSEEVAQQLSKNITDVLQSLNTQSVQAKIEKTNNADGFAVTMVPMMIVLASFVGSMIMSLNVNIVSTKLKSISSKWSILLARSFINFGAAFLLTFITLLFLAIFHIELKTTLLETGLFQLLVYFSFLSITQMFVVLFGPGGMLFNILGLSLQLVTSGVIVPRAMLSDFYHTIGSYLPATYAADGYYTVIFGGGNMTADMGRLLLITAFAFVIVLIKVMFQRSYSMARIKQNAPTH